MNHSTDKLVEDYELLLNEYTILRRKLDSKVEALLILSKELEQCRIERDQYQHLTEQMRERYCGRRRSTDGKSVIQLMCEMKEENKNLRLETCEVRQKLTEAQGDIKLLREQMVRQRAGSCDEEANVKQFLAHEREDLVKKLEGLKVKNSMLERDLQLVLDEKEELINERDSYKLKVERLNNELHYVLKGDEKRIIDVDALVMENRYLQERLKQIQEEKSLYLQTLSKYKAMLERRRNQGSLKLGSNGSGGVIITHKQVQIMLQNTSLNQLPMTQATIADLRSLALALFESLNDKNLALAHQKKANKILGTRVTELENKIKKAETNPFPATQNLNNYDGDEHENALADLLQNIGTSSPVPKEQLSTETDDLVDASESDRQNLEAEKLMLKIRTESECSEEQDEELPPTLLKLVQEALDSLEKETAETDSVGGENYVSQD